MKLYVMVPHEKVRQAGFTLIELMISMAIGLLLLLGMTMMFTSDAKVSKTLASRTESLGDLYLVSQILQSDLRGSVSDPAPAYPADLQSGGRKPAGTCTSPNQSVSLPDNYPSSFTELPYWDATSKTLTYQDPDGNTGIIQYQRTENDRIYWLRPDPCVYQFEEIVRGLDPASGMTVIASGTSPKVYTITLKSAFKNEDRDIRTLDLSFKAWARN